MEDLKEYNVQIKYLDDLLAHTTDATKHDMLLMKLNYLKSLRNALENRILKMSYSGLLVETMEKLSELDENNIDDETLRLI